MILIYFFIADWGNAGATTAAEATTKAAATTTKAAATTTKAAATTSKAAASTSKAASATQASSSAEVTSVALTSDSITSISSITSSDISSSSATSSGVLATATIANDSTSSSGISGGAIGGIVAAIVIIIAGIVAYLFVRRRANQKQRINNNPRLSKAAFGQAMQEQPYQHQYGTNVNSPASPFAFDDPNQHIITPIQQYQPAIAEQYNYNDSYVTSPTATSYPPVTNEVAPVNYAAPVVTNYNAPIADATVTNTVAPVITTTAAPAVTEPITATATAAAATTMLQPTQPGSLGVFTVIATYSPTLSDEVDIQAGDQVEVLVEYDDGWCQGINLSRGNAKGVFPKHCTNYGSNNTPSIHSAKRVSSMYAP